MPQVEVDETLWGKKIEWYRAYILNTHADDAYWQQGWWHQLSEIPQKVTLPLYIISGWYDHHHGSTMKTWERLSDVAKEHSWLEIGGWNHFFMPAIQGKKVEHLENSELLKMLKWFELTLKQKKVPTKRIRTYNIGEDCWQESTSWELMTREVQKFYFGADGTLSPTSLNNCIDCVENSISYTYNPQDPVMSHGGEALLKSVMQHGGSILQPPSGSRTDVVSFVSAPLEEPLSINGKIQVALYVQSTCEDTAFTAKIMEETSEGDAYNIRTSITTIGQGASLEVDPLTYVSSNVYSTKTQSPYIPGTPIKVIVDLWDIVYTVAKGAKLRVDISSSDFPQYHIHSNYAGPWARQEKTQVAQQTILCGASYPSVLNVPTSGNAVKTVNI